ncbi:MAG: hypothetical protein HQ528_01770 [Candidatus Marinimicrobia bacterium]|nr:hypothetical protein [Candidatus Neomarinimicrobiota bacterium]
MSTKKNEKITFRTTTKIKEALNVLSDSQDRTVSYIINSLLNNYFKKQPILLNSEAVSKYHAMEWIKYSFLKSDVAQGAHSEFIDSIRNIILYSQKAAKALLVIGYYEEDISTQVVLISESSNILALDVLARKYEPYYRGSGHKLPKMTSKLNLHFGDKREFQEISSIYID